jgi:hypothetical protein
MNDYKISFIVELRPKEVFDAIINVRGWWGEDVQGNTDTVGDEFTYRVEGVHFCKLRVTELIPNKKVTWLVLDNNMSFVEDQTEWVGTTISFEIGRENGQTEVRFTHVGLQSQFECFDVCSDAWGSLMHTSLPSLISTETLSYRPKLLLVRRHLRCWGAVGLPARRRHRTPGEGTAALGGRRRFRQRTVSSSTWAPAPSPAFGQHCPHILRPCSGAGMAHFRDACADCPLREACTTSKAGRTIEIPAYEELVRAQRERCAGPELCCRLPRGPSQGRAQVRPLDEAPPWGRRARVRGGRKVDPISTC